MRDSTMALPRRIVAWVSRWRAIESTSVSEPRRAGRSALSRASEVAMLAPAPAWVGERYGTRTAEDSMGSGSDPGRPNR